MHYLALAAILLFSSCSFTFVTQESGTLKLLPINIETVSKLQEAIDGQANKENREIGERDGYEAEET
jgi:hypothetical protein